MGESGRDPWKYSDEALVAAFQRYNTTELYQAARGLGLPVYPGTSRQELIARITGLPQPGPQASHPIDEWRHGLMGGLLDHWETVHAQLLCPAKSGDPLSCFQCIDTQVISCLVDNAMNEPLFQIRKKPAIPAPENVMTDQAQITVENAPRDVNELMSKCSRYVLRHLANKLELLTNPGAAEAFAVANMPTQAATVLEGLKKWDAAQGKSPVKRPKVVEEPAEQEEEEEIKREPVYVKKEESTADTPVKRGPGRPKKNPEQATESSGATDSSDDAGLRKEVKDLRSEVKELTVAVDILTKESRTQQKMLRRFLELAKVSTGASMELLKNLMGGASEPEVTEEALNTGIRVDKAMQAALGKAE